MADKKEEEKKGEEAAPENPEEAAKKKKKKLIIFAVLGLLLVIAGGAGAFFVLSKGKSSDHKEEEISKENLESHDAHGAPAKDEHGAPAKDKHGAAKADAHGAPAKDEHGAAKKDDHGAPAKDEHGDAKKGADAPAAAAAVASDVDFGETYKLQTFNLNLGNAIENRYIRIEISLEYRGGEKQKAEIERRLPQLRDAIIGIVQRKTREFLLSPDGKEALRKEILIRLNRYMNQKIESVYITDLLIE